MVEKHLSDKESTVAVEQQNRNIDIWEKVYHTDARVSAMETELGNVTAGVVRIEAHLLNKPEINVTAWIGVVLTGLGLMVGMLFGMVNYVDIKQQPIIDSLAARDVLLKEYQDFRKDTAYEHGRQDALNASMKESVDLNRTRLHAVEKEVNRIDSEGSKVWARDRGQ